MRIFKTLLVCLSVVVPCGVFGKSLEEALGKFYEESHIGVVVSEAGTGKVVYEHNGGHLFHPGSTLKVLVGAYGLDTFGAGHQFEIKAYLKGGDLVLVFDTCPNWSMDNIRQLFEMLVDKHGIVGISGDVIVVAPQVGDVVPFKGYFEVDYETVEIAKIEYPIIHNNEYLLMLRPGENVGSLAYLEEGEDSPRLMAPGFTKDVLSKVETVEAGKRGYRKYLEASDNLYLIDGQIPMKHKGLKIQLPVEDHFGYVAGIIEDAMDYAGIGLEGEVHEGVLENFVGMEFLGSLRSQPLKQMLVGPMRRSENTFFAALLLACGLELNAELGSHDEVIGAFKGFLEKRLKYEGSGELEIMDFGLSRYTVMTPREYHDLLSRLYADKELWVDMHKALVESSLNKNLKGKTGTLKNLSNFAGIYNDEYLLTVFNFGKEPRRIRDEVIKEVVKGLQR